MKIKTDENGFITAAGSGLTDYDHEYDGEAEIEPANPERNNEAWNYNDGNPEIKETGANIPPDPDEAKQKLFAHATDENGFGWDRSKLRTVRREEGLFFDFIDAENYAEAKVEATETSNLTESETHWVHDLLDGEK